MTLRSPSGELPVRVVLGSIAAFWVGWVVLMSARAALIGFVNPEDLLARRFMAAIAGALLTLLFWRVLRRIEAERPAALIVAAVVGAVPAAIAFACVNWFLFYGWAPPPSMAADVARWGEFAVFRFAVVETSVTWLFFFGGWATLYLFLRSAARSLAAERARTQAELTALRYQINPHFLFNALNALSDLVMTGRVHDADRMILELSALLRRMLADPDAPNEIRLDEEVELQRLYLALERRRFEDRLSISVELPPPLMGRTVPRLILQPLVENAVKHALGGTSAPVTIGISVAVQRGELVLSVEDDGEPSLPSMRREGFGIGLANVRERLRTTYGDAARLEAGPLPGRGYRSRITLPDA